MSIQPGRAVTAEEKAAAQEHLNRARAAMRSVDGYDQATVDRLCRAVAWATANEETFGRLTRMSVDESGMGSAEGVPARRWKILGILRDALRTQSVGIIEELPEKGIVKYAKPAGVIAGLLPVTNPLVTMVNTRISKTQNHGSGCSCDGNLLVEATVYDRFLELLQKEGGYLASADEKARLEAVMWDAEGRRTIDTVARAASVIAEKAGITLPA